MKLLFLSFFSFLAVTAASAQKFEIGLNGGRSYNTNPTIITDNSGYRRQTKAPGSTTAANVKALINCKKWQFGLQGGYMQLSYSAENLISIGVGDAGYSTVFISKTAIPVTAIVNRRVTFGRFENYAGVSCGYILAKGNNDPEALAPQYIGKVNGNGFSAGLQAGTTYFFSKHFGLNGEVSCNYMNITLGAASYKLFAFPGTMGIRYKF